MDHFYPIRFSIRVFLFTVNILYSLHFLMILSSILVRSIEKSDPFKLVELVLKFDYVWIPYFRTLEFKGFSCLSWNFTWNKEFKVREVIYVLI